jgi:hypothetical protein
VDLLENAFRDRRLAIIELHLAQEVVDLSDAHVARLEDVLPADRHGE